MWKKPTVNESKMDLALFEKMDEEQLMNNSGGNVGVCYVAGWTCWSEGGWKIGTCYVVGIACNFSKGGV